MTTPVQLLSLENLGDVYDEDVVWASREVLESERRDEDILAELNRRLEARAISLGDPVMSVPASVFEAHADRLVLIRHRIACATGIARQIIDRVERT